MLRFGPSALILEAISDYRRLDVSEIIEEAS